MSWWRLARGFAVLAIAMLAGCAAMLPHSLSRPPPRQLHSEFLAMGTRISVTLRVDAAGDERLARTAIDGVQRLMRDFGRRWWAWGDGELAGINRELNSGRVAEIPPGMQPLFARAWQLHLAGGGRFEPRIGALVRLWGFDDIARLRSAPPKRRAIAAALAALHAAPAYDGGVPYGPAPGVNWDFGAIAKGWVIDAALAQLRAAGFGDALIDAGGNLAVRGAPGARPWRIAIRDPRAPATGRAFLAQLDARDESVNTHADDQRFFEADGRRYGHILDPKTGWPARGLDSVTVVHGDGALADAGGLALYVAGPRGWRALSRELGLEEVLVVDERGRAYATPELARRLQPEPGVMLNVVP